MEEKKNSLMGVYAIVSRRTGLTEMYSNDPRNHLLAVVRYLVTLLTIAVLTSILFTWETDSTLARNNSIVKTYFHSLNVTQMLSLGENNSVGQIITGVLHKAHNATQQSPNIQTNNSKYYRNTVSMDVDRLKLQNTVIRSVESNGSLRRLQEIGTNKQIKCEVDTKYKCTKLPKISSTIPSPSPSVITTSLQTISYLPTLALQPTTGYQSYQPANLDTASNKPTIDITGYDTTMITRGGEVGIASTCRNTKNIPNTIFQQVIRFQYILNSHYWADPIVSVDMVDSQVHRLLAINFLDDCMFLNETKAFHTVSISTIPTNDEILYDSCSVADRIQNATCVVVHASVRVGIFLSNKQRRILLEIKEHISEMIIVDVFSQSLGQLFQQINLQSSGIVGVKFSRLINYGPTSAPTSSTNNSTTTTTHQQNAKIRRTRLRISFVIILIILIFVLGLVIGYKRREHIQRELKRVKYSTKVSFVSPRSIKKSLIMLMKQSSRNKDDTPDMYNEVLSSGRSDEKKLATAVSRTSANPLFNTDDYLSDTLDARYNKNENINNSKTKWDGLDGSSSQHKRDGCVDKDNHVQGGMNNTAIDIKLYDGEESFVTGLGSKYIMNDDEILDYSEETIIFEAPTFVSVTDIISLGTREKMIASIQEDLGRQKQKIQSVNDQRKYTTYEDTVDL